MGIGAWYEDKIVPRIIKCGCRSENIMELREQVIPLAAGRVFELGCGAGINQRYYDAAKVENFAGIDPSAKLLQFAQEEVQRKGMDADIRLGFGEAIPFDDDSFDTVVSTFTLCSVNDQGQSLRELRRILKPGGKMLFVEHGRAPDAAVQKWQRRIEPVWRKLMGNCHLSRPIAQAVEAAGFSVTALGQKYMDKAPRFAGWVEWGSAQKVP